MPTLIYHWLDERQILLHFPQFPLETDVN